MYHVCPKCGKEYDSYPAISRRDNETEICPGCGEKEAIEDYLNYIKNNRILKDNSFKE